MNILEIISDISSLESRGIHFFRDLSILMCNRLPIDYVLIGVLNADRRSVNSLSFFRNGEDVGSFNYELNSTPCDIALTKERKIKCYRSDLKKAFPSDEYIDQFSLKSYYGSPLLNNEGDLIGIMAIFNTDENSAEEEDCFRTVLRLVSRLAGLELMHLELANKLNHKDRLITLGMKVSTIAHELNNPLTILTLGLERLKDVSNKNKLSDDITRVIDINIKAVENIDKMIKDVLSFSQKVEHLDFTEIDVHETLETVMNLTREIHGVRQNIFLCSLKASNSKVLASEGKIDQVLINLMANSIHAMKGTGKESRISINTFNDSENIYIEVEDNGPGINPEIVNNIFDTYFTTKSRDEGTGLGLSICRSLVLEMKGKISVISSVGEGSKFTILLPCIALELN
jgi:signal transduction histidine kinase